MKATLDVDAFRRSVRARLAPTSDKMQRIADAALGQVNDRFSTGGASGDAPWKPSDFGTMGRKPPLNGLQDRFNATAVFGEAKVATSDFVSLVHHLGTTIVPVRAKALYLPLTPLGLFSYQNFKGMSPIIRTIVKGVPRVHRPDASKGFKAIYGRDFIFAKKVTIPARPQLPNSQHERAALATVVLATLKS